MENQGALCGFLFKSHHKCMLKTPSGTLRVGRMEDVWSWSSLRVQFSWWLKKIPLSATNNFLAKCSANYHHQLLGDSNVVNIWRQRKIFILSQHFEPEKGCLKQNKKKDLKTKNKKQQFLCSSCWPAVEESTLLSQPPATAGCTNTLELIHLQTSNSAICKWLEFFSQLN